MHIKKHKGDVGLTCAMAELTKQEINVSIPISEHLKYDLIAEKDGVLKRVQVRHAKAINGSMSVKLRSIWSNRAGNHVVVRKKGDFDILAAYCPETGKTYFIDDASFDCESTITFRIASVRESGGGISRMSEDFVDCSRFFV